MVGPTHQVTVGQEQKGNYQLCGAYEAAGEPDKPAASSASHGLVNLRRSFSPDPALAQALPVPVGHADRN